MNTFKTPQLLSSPFPAVRMKYFIPPKMFDSEKYERSDDNPQNEEDVRRLTIKEKVERLQKKGEVLRDYFEDITKNKRKYDKIKTNRDLTAEESNLDRIYAERLSIFLNLSEKFIRPRKNGFGKFSVEDFVNYNLARDAILKGQSVDMKMLDPAAISRQKPQRPVQMSPQERKVDQHPGQYAINMGYVPNGNLNNQVVEILNDFDVKQSQMSSNQHNSQHNNQHGNQMPRRNFVRSDAPNPNFMHDNMIRSKQEFNVRNQQPRQQNNGFVSQSPQYQQMHSPVMRFPQNMKDFHNMEAKDSQFLAPQNIMLSNMAKKSSQMTPGVPQTPKSQGYNNAPRSPQHYSPVNFNGASYNNNHYKPMSPVINPNLKTRNNFIDEPVVVSRAPKPHSQQFMQKINLISSMNKPKMYANKFVNIKIPNMKPQMNYVVGPNENERRISVSECFDSEEVDTTGFYPNLKMSENIALKLDGSLHQILRTACLISSTRPEKNLLLKDVKLAFNQCWDNKVSERNKKKNTKDEEDL